MALENDKTSAKSDNTGSSEVDKKPIDEKSALNKGDTDAPKAKGSCYYVHMKLS